MGPKHTGPKNQVKMEGRDDRKKEIKRGYLFEYFYMIYLLFLHVIEKICS